MGLSGSILAGYLVFRDVLWKQNREFQSKNALEVTLPQLIQGIRHAQIKKIIVTTCPTSKGFFRKKLIDFMKAHLSESGVKVLINCSVSTR